MNKLSLRDILRHLEQLIAAVPEIGGVFENDNDAASFVTKLRRLLDLVQDTGNAEPALKAIREALFPGAKEDSRRVLFSNFRKTLALAASHTGKNLALVQPNLRGKELDEVLCWFEGDGFPAEPEIAAATQRSIAGLDRSTLIHAPAAMMTGATLTKITENLREKDARGRQRIHLFISYAHKNDALASKCLNQLRDELAISKRYDFRIWQDTRILVGNEWHQDIQQALRECDLCLALCSPAFFASEYITGEELPLIVNRTLPGVPVMLEPVDFKRHDLHGAEDLQFYTLKENAREKAYTECTGEVAKRFVRGLAEKIEERVPSAIEDVTRRTITNALSDPERWMAFVKTHPKIGEILATIPQKPRNLEATATNTSRERFDRLLRHVLPENPDRLIDAVCAGGGLRELSRQIQRRHDGPDYEDPYDRFRSNQYNAVQYLTEWVRDPDAPPFAAVLGEIGSGKTTTLKMLTAALITRADSPPVIFIDLRDYFSAGEPKLEDLLAEHIRRYDTEKSLSVEELLRVVREQNGLIIFDGLDEKIISLGEAARQNFIRELWRMLPAETLDRPASEGRGKLIISCRSHYFPSVQTQSSGYLAHDRSAVTANDYLACIMLPWQDEQIRDYLAGCVGEDKVEMALELIETIHNLKDLSTRPYLLNLIGPELEALERERASGRPINAASLYDQFIERWFARDEGKHVFTPVHKRRLMEQLAADLWRDNAREWPWELVEEWLDEFLYSHPAMADGYREYPRAVLKQDFRTATMFLRPDAASDAFRFAHTSLQEYFLACHLARSLYTREGLDTKTWDLPSPSQETFEFTGQLLQLLPARERELAMARLKALLGNAEATVATRTGALNYFVVALKERFPVPDRPDLEMQGVDITAWEIDARTLGPVSLGSVNFSGATLIRTRIEGVDFPEGSIWRGADLRGSMWADCELIGAEFCAATLDGAWFRNCDLRGTSIEDDGAARTMIHLCKLDADHSWPVRPQPAAASLVPQQSHSGAVTEVSTSQNGVFFTSSRDGTLKCWQTHSGFCLKNYEGHVDWVNSVVISANGENLASSGDDGSLITWNTKTAEIRRAVGAHQDIITKAAYASDGRYLVTGSWDRNVNLWSANELELIKTFRGHSEPILYVDFSPDGKQVVSSSEDGTFNLWEVESGLCSLKRKADDSPLTVSVFSPDNQFVLTATVKGRISIWHRDSGDLVRTWMAHSLSVNSISFSPDGQFFVTTSDDVITKIWSMVNYRCEKTLFGHMASVKSAIFLPDGIHLVSTSEDSTIRIWDLKREICIRVIHARSPWLANVVSNFDKSLFLLCDTNGDMKCLSSLGVPLALPSNVTDILSTGCSHTDPARQFDVIGQSTIRLVEDNRLLRDIIPLRDGKTLVLEPWDEIEAIKPPHECRWKLVRGPADAWRYAVAVDPETLEVHPPEYATENGTWEII